MTPRARNSLWKIKLPWFCVLSSGLWDWEPCGTARTAQYTTEFTSPFLFLLARIEMVRVARPNFMKMAPVMLQLRRLGVPQKLIHTGQRYDRV